LRSIVRPLEVGIYKICGVREDDEQHWVSYAVAMLAFSFAGTSVSFMTNTNRQSYVPETTMSYLTQMIALTVHNFVSAAAGIVLTVVLIRGFARRSMQTLGNSYVDLTRCVVYILLPISIVVGLVLIACSTTQCRPGGGRFPTCLPGMRPAARHQGFRGCFG
jgi:potassium-transporting ATPase potassium-binding subunit